MDLERIKALILNLESDRIERTTSFREDKLGPVVCAFANDFPAHRLPGYILVGVKDDGRIAGISISDEDLQKIGNVKSNGNVLPQPSLVVSQVFAIEDGDVVVVEVKPTNYPPVRYKGNCWIRVGPRQSKATIEEERILTERRASFAKTYDIVPAPGATVKDLKIEHFTNKYLPAAIDEDVLQENRRSLEDQLASLRFYDNHNNCPTHAGILMFGNNPEYYLPGAYIQYVKFDGPQMTDDVAFEKKFSGSLITVLVSLDDFIRSNILKSRPQRMDSIQEKTIMNYPFWALRELIMNAIMHRNYESNSPIYIYEFTDKIEIVNPGGLYGEVTPQNFPNASDYRNVVIAEALKVLGYVNRFNFGIKRAKDELIKNGNGEPDFDLSLVTKFKVTIPINQQW